MLTPKPLPLMLSPNPPTLLLSCPNMLPMSMKKSLSPCHLFPQGLCVLTQPALDIMSVRVILFALSVLENPLKKQR